MRSPKEAVGYLLSLAGYEVRRRTHWPRDRLLGLAERPIRTVLDVGANTGQFARQAAKLFPDAEICSFEPQPDAFRELAAWANAHGRARAFNVALGDTDATLAMRVHVDHHYSSSLLGSTTLLDQTYPQTRNQATAEVPVRTLDEFVKATMLELQPEILIKLDVQGYEDRVISGGAGVFGQAAACIVEVNLDLLYEGQAAFHDLHSRLHALGFRYAGNLEQEHAPDGHVIYLDAVFLK